jgi:S1-C subfamily serine protease
LLVVSLLAWLAYGAEAQSVAEVFRKVNSSVVLIRARGRDVSASAGGLVRFNEIGSGIIISADGQVMTAAHIVNAMDEITVETLGGAPVRARVLSSEPAADLALLKLDGVPPSWAPAPMADTDSVMVGDQVMVIGAPYGLSHSLSVGWISARWAPNTVYGAMPLAEFFQTTATINRGNSGGPMFNMTGEVVGIVSHNISKSGGSEGLGFVVTINTARMLLLQERSFWSGLSGQIVSGDLAVILNLSQPTGYLVKTVAKDSPGWHMGLQGGDKVATIDGQQVAVGGDIILAVEGMPVGKAEDHARESSPRREDPRADGHDPLSSGAGIKARGQRSLETDALEELTSGALGDHDLTGTGRPLLGSPVDQRRQKNSRQEQKGQNPASEFHLSPERWRRG